MCTEHAVLRLGDYKNYRYILIISDCWFSAMVQHFHFLVSSIVDQNSLYLDSSNFTQLPTVHYQFGKMEIF